MNENEVWIVLGWFGGNEWIESVWATKEAAEAESARLWETRTGENGPEYCAGFHKFGAELFEVKRRA